MRHINNFAKNFVLFTNILMQIKITNEKEARNLKVYFNIRIIKKPICLNKHDLSNIADVLNK
jgi:hypothetical protein